MKRKKISGAQYLEELNRAYEKTEGYDPQNRFKRPNGAAASSGIEIGLGPYTVWTHAHSLANQRVSEEFEHDPSS